MRERFKAPSSDPADHPPFLATKLGCVTSSCASIALVVAATAAVHGLTGWPWPPMVPVAILAAFLLTLFVALHAGMRHATVIGEHIGKQVMRKHREIRTLTAHAARKKAMVILNDPSQCRCVRGDPGDAAILAQLGPELRDFFREFERVEGPFYAAREEIAPSEWMPGMIRIGDPYGDGHVELVINSHDDAIYALDLEEPQGERELEHLASTIWHYVLMESEVDVI